MQIIVELEKSPLNLFVLMYDLRITSLSLQIWVKTAEVLARDRLLGSFQVSCFLRLKKFNYYLSPEKCIVFFMECKCITFLAEDSHSLIEILW